MELTQTAAQQVDFAKSCFLQGMCSSKEYLKAIKTIYEDDVKKQVDFLVEQGFKQLGAYKHVYNLDKEELL